PFTFGFFPFVVRPGIVSSLTSRAPERARPALSPYGISIQRRAEVIARFRTAGNVRRTLCPDLAKGCSDSTAAWFGDATTAARWRTPFVDALGFTRWDR